MMDFVAGVFEYIFSRILSITVFDIVDIAIVSIVFYYVFKFVRDRRAGKLAVGILFILVLLLVSDLFNMYALNFLISNVMQVGIIGLVIVFQSELRFLLEKVGGNNLITGINRKGDKKIFSDVVKCINSVTNACSFFSNEAVGALIVFERSTKLGDVIKTGTVIDAEPEEYLIKNIFFNKAPLHDGALVIRGNRLYSAGCFLPLSASEGINKDLGTRHRAALGMSENSDAIVVVVSEETGTISVAKEGVLKRDFTKDTLKQYLLTEFSADAPEKKPNPLKNAFKR